MFGKGSIAREAGKAFAISFAATFGSMAGLVAFGVAVEKYIDRRPAEKATPKVFQIDKRTDAMKKAGYSEPEIDETLPGKNPSEDDTGDDSSVVTKD
jgi:hypothetical protein